MSPNQIDGFISGTSSDLDSKTLGYGLVFLHEMNHTEVGINKSDFHDPKSNTGPVVDLVNKVRSESGASYGQRTSYKSLALSRGSSTSYIPFSKGALKKLNSGRV